MIYSYFKLLFEKIYEVLFPLFSDKSIKLIRLEKLIDENYEEYHKALLQIRDGSKLPIEVKCKNGYVIVLNNIK